MASFLGNDDKSTDSQESIPSSEDLLNALQLLNLGTINTERSDLIRAWKSVSRSSHPDKGGSNEKQQEVNKCKDILLRAKDLGLTQEYITGEGGNTNSPPNPKDNTDASEDGLGIGRKGSSSNGTPTPKKGKGKSQGKGNVHGHVQGKPQDKDKGKGKGKGKGQGNGKGNVQGKPQDEGKSEGKSKGKGKGKGNVQEKPQGEGRGKGGGGSRCRICEVGFENAFKSHQHRCCNPKNCSNENCSFAHLFKVRLQDEREFLVWLPPRNMACENCNGTNKGANRGPCKCFSNAPCYESLRRIGAIRVPHTREENRGRAQNPKFIS